ncbi:MAG: DMT family transporter [Alphaproteobacteria bacterium]|nr:DMT family transporter [Alphaproteobacteria bacterium]
MSAYSAHVKGLLITSAGYLALTPDALLIRLISADHWTVAFWRSLFMAAALAAFMALRHRGAMVAPARALGRWGVWAAIAFAVSTIFFVASINLTTVANALIIFSLAPLFAAIFSRIFLDEPVPPRTWLAIAAAIGGLCVIVYPSMQGIEISGQSAIGDLAALCNAIAFAAFLTILRRGRTVDMVPGLLLSGLITAALMVPLATPFTVTGVDFAMLAILGVVVTPVAFTLISIGPRYLSAAEVGLLTPLETVIAPFWVWLVLAEEPGPYALAGGAVVIATLLVHSLAALRGDRAVANPRSKRRSG